MDELNWSQKKGNTTANFWATQYEQSLGALLICSQMGIDPLMFYEAIPSFTGASKRLELSD